MGKITFVKGQGGLNRRQPGEDHISAFLIYSSTLPAGFGANDRIKEVNDLVGAETLGIVGTTGTDLLIRVMHYHISEFYRRNPGAKLFIAIYDEPVGELTFAEIETVQNFAEGKIRQMAIWSKKAFATGHFALIQTILDTLDSQHKYISSVLLATNLVGVTTANLANLRGLVASKVSGVLAQDGGAKGKALYTEAATYSITAVGALLGAVSLAKVSECIGWVEKFPMNATELDVPAFANGDLVKNLTEATLEAVDGKGWIFLRKYESDGQVYFNDSHTAVVATNDYAFIEANRTMDKAMRAVRKKLLPQLNGPVLVDPQTGKLAPDYVTHLENLGDQGLEEMERNGELSGYRTFVDPDQNVLSTSEVQVVIINVPVGVSRNFKVKVSYATKLP
jgi:hypothetical protein